MVLLSRPSFAIIATVVILVVGLELASPNLGVQARILTQDEIHRLLSSFHGQVLRSYVGEDHLPLVFCDPRAPQEPPRLDLLRQVDTVGVSEVTLESGKVGSILLQSLVGFPHQTHEEILKVLRQLSHGVKLETLVQTVKDPLVASFTFQIGRLQVIAQVPRFSLQHRHDVVGGLFLPSRQVHLYSVKFTSASELLVVLLLVVKGRDVLVRTSCIDCGFGPFTRCSSVAGRHGRRSLREPQPLAEAPLPTSVGLKPLAHAKLRGYLKALASHVSAANFGHNGPPLSQTEIGGHSMLHLQ